MLPNNAAYSFGHSVSRRLTIRTPSILNYKALHTESLRLSIVKQTPPNKSTNLFLRRTIA
jgi:hypothetical protein